MKRKAEKTRIGELLKQHRRYIKPAPEGAGGIVVQTASATIPFKTREDIERGLRAFLKGRSLPVM